VLFLVGFSILIICLFAAMLGSGAYLMSDRAVFDPWWAGALVAMTALTIGGAVWLVSQARFSTNRSS
jgi:Trk-type K+ transport system membrane component